MIHHISAKAVSFCEDQFFSNLYHGFEKMKFIRLFCLAIFSLRKFNAGLEGSLILAISIARSVIFTFRHVQVARLGIMQN